MLEVRNLNISYHNKKAINDVSFKVSEGEIFCIVGESGSGKTTMIKSIMGLLPSDAEVDSGSIFYQGKLVCQGQILAPEISMVFQDSRGAMNPVRKIGVQFIQYIRKYKKCSKDEAKVLATDTLVKVKLNPQIMGAYPYELSGGMMQRVGIAFSLSLAPKLLLLDEPTSALDVTTQAQVIDEIIHLKEEFNVTIVMITHNIPLAIYMADKVLVMEDGRVVEESEPLCLLHHPKHSYTKTLIDNIP